LVMAGGDDDVQTGPVASDGTTPAPAASAVLEFRPVLLVGPCRDLGASALPSADGTGDICFQVGEALPGNELIESVGRYASFSGVGTPLCEGAACELEATTSTVRNEEGVSLTLTPDGIERFNALARVCFERADTCPTGQLAIVVDGVVLSAPTITQPSFAGDEVQLSGDLTAAEADALADALQPRPLGTGTTTTVPDDQVDPADPTIGAPGDAAKDVAERTMREVFGDESVTTAAGDGTDGLTIVTMETSTGAEVVARVAYDEDLGVSRLVSLQSGKLQVFDDLGHLSIPAAGRLWMAHLAAPLAEPDVLVEDLAIDRPGTDHGPFVIPNNGWLMMTLALDDGRVLYHLSPR
jgi:hypothetical protein